MVSAAHTKAVLVSAVASGQGKTSVTAALARKLSSQGQRVRVFKTGPDFIDPMMLERACGQPVHSLDLWMVGLEQSRALLAQAAQQADVILIEGMMGLYDGTPSSADLARAFGVPVLAVVDAAAMAQTAAAVALGLRDYGPAQLAGVIFNQVASTGHADMIAAAMKGIPMFGSLARQRDGLPERHLGLVLPQEVKQLDAILDNLADQLQLDQEAWDGMPSTAFGIAPDDHQAPLLQGKTIAIARDAAFAFLYPANLACLRTLGAQCLFFSPLQDQPVPPEADAIFLPGGYPELHAETLAGAARWQASMRAVRGAGLPVLAECGGMMVLTEAMIDQAGKEWPMLGWLPGKVTMQERLAAIGSQAWATTQGEIRGHAFHYSRFDTDMRAAAHTCKHPGGQDGEAIYRSGVLTASYFHAYFPSNPAAVAALLTRDPT